jgi:hypothetical protein
VVTRITPTTHQGKTVNARRVGGKLILMVDWEPVFVRQDDDVHFYALYWECPECDTSNHIVYDDCQRCGVD